MFRKAGFGAMATVSALLAGCRSEPPVLFIVPDRYSGPIVVMDDPAAPPLELVNGRYEIVVPTQGFVKIPKHPKDNRHIDE